MLCSGSWIGLSGGRDSGRRSLGRSSPDARCCWLESQIIPNIPTVSDSLFSWHTTTHPNVIPHLVFRGPTPLPHPRPHHHLKSEKPKKERKKTNSSSKRRPVDGLGIEPRTFRRTAGISIQRTQDHAKRTLYQLSHTPLWSGVDSSPVMETPGRGSQLSIVRVWPASEGGRRVLHSGRLKCGRKGEGCCCR